jgi:hypothetical protein
MKHENWLQSFNKWDKIVRYIEEGKTQLVRIDRVRSPCGYCFEYKNNKTYGSRACDTCPLWEKRLCGAFRSAIYKFQSCVWDYVDRRLTNPDWPQALIYAREIRDFIKNDEPK